MELALLVCTGASATIPRGAECFRTKRVAIAVAQLLGDASDAATRDLAHAGDAAPGLRRAEVERRRRRPAASRLLIGRGSRRVTYAGHVHAEYASEACLADDGDSFAVTKERAAPMKGGFYSPML
eukprot:scaffold1733_cov257-Pinguiococcus_pyrenoidosus.AAC.3